MHRSVPSRSGARDMYTENFLSKDRIPIDTRLLPLAVVVLATAIQILWVIYRQIRFRTSKYSNAETRAGIAIDSQSPRPLRTSGLANHVHLSEGFTIYVLWVIRLIATTTLLFLSVTTLYKCAVGCADKATLVRDCPEYGITASLLYATVMAVVLVVSETQGSLAGGLNIFVLLVVLGVYSYRDIYPLATYSQEPADIREGKVLWGKIFTLTMASLIIPLFTPRPYVPVDLKEPMPIPNPEQTASWISRFTFSYLNPVISLAAKIPHLSYQQLPPLMDDDSAKYQASNAFQYIEPSRVTRRHIFFGLLRHFGRDYTLMGISMFISCILTFLSPIGIKQTLRYLETGGEGSTHRPWLWISLLFIGPLLGSISENWCLFIETKIRVHLQAVLTQIVFEHSLRIRLKAETSDAKGGDLPAAISTGLEDVQTLSLEANQFDSQQAAVAKNAGPATGEKNTADNNLFGKINNLVTTDLDNMAEGVDFLTFVIRIPLQVSLCLVFLYQILGWSSFVGFGAILAITPLGAYAGKKMQDVQATKMKMTDARVQRISEAINVLRMIKLFGWENKTRKRLDQSREIELKWLWRMKSLSIYTNMISYLIPMLSMLLTYTTYTIIMKKELNPSTIFSSMAVFQILIDQLDRIAWQVPPTIEGKVSLDRLNDFIQNTEVLDRFTVEARPSLLIVTGEDHADEIGFRNATYTWSVATNDGCLTPTSRRFSLHIGDKLLFKQNCINLIIGPTGSGKSSLLMALLGEMHFIPSGVDAWYNLPRAGGVAYAAQESWVQNATIRENILFGSPYDEERYQKVLWQCALEPDLKLFEAGDQTEVGERGLTLSGGQKARVTLARAIYSSAQIILLDDVLAALDVHTSSWIVDKCFCGDLVKGRTILLVTHNVALVGSLAQFIVSLGLDGEIRSQGSDISTALSSDPVLASEVEHDKERAEKEAIQTPAGPIPTGKLMVPEEIAEGHITWKSMNLLLSGFGGDHPIVFFTIVVAGILGEQLFTTGQTWFLGVWGAQYEKHRPSEVNLTFYLTTFTLLLLGNMTVFSLTNFYYNYRWISASRAIHNKLINSVFGTTLRWLDQTPTSRILARCTQDIRTIDSQIGQSLMYVYTPIVGALIKLSVIAYMSPTFLFPGVLIGLLGISFGNLYLKAQLSVKRELSNARSPMLAHFSAAIHGLVSLRAYNAQQSFKNESYERINHYVRTARVSWALNRWIGFRIDALGATFTAALAAYLVYGPTASASNTGFSLNLAVSFSMNIFWLIRMFNQLEVQSNSLERIQDYIDIEHEPPSTEAGTPPASWPTSGALCVKNLNARYSLSGPKVLKDLSFNIVSGERIGVVGRTGSGKSSLTLALLRCILTDGTVYYDGIPTTSVNLDALRSNITIIPQTPELLSGTLRENLDPFDENDDSTLNDALRSSGLLSLQRDDANITLDTQISGGGSNLSVGQRQIIALARAIIRRSKLLILDEATSAVDYQTDAVIQRTLRTEIGSDVTVITIAHRLQTIMDSDKIMVLDSGCLVEFDTPKNLLSNEKGVLRTLVEGSGDKQNLFALADNKGLQNLI